MGPMTVFHGTIVYFAYMNGGFCMGFHVGKYTSPMDSMEMSIVKQHGFFQVFWVNQLDSYGKRLGGPRQKTLDLCVVETQKFFFVIRSS